jgi:leucyl-tRNA synthetase
LVDEFGVDALRLHLMYLGPWEQGGPWNSRGIAGMERFIRRAFTVVTETAAGPFDAALPPDDTLPLRRLTHRTIERVSNDLDDFQFNTMVAALIEFVNELMRLKDGPLARTPEWREAIETLVLLMAPSTPYAAEELWERLGNPYSVHLQAWPVFDPVLTRQELVEVAVQVNGKLRDRLQLAVDAPEADAIAAARASAKVQEHLGDKEPAKVIYVPGRILNIVIR